MHSKNTTADCRGCPAPYRDERVLTLRREELTQGKIPVRIFPEEKDVFTYLAQTMADIIQQHDREAKPTLMIVPLGPVGQYEYLAEMINQNNISLKQTTFLNMDEYMWDDKTFIDPAHPLSFRGAMNRLFYDRVKPELLMPEVQRIFPDFESMEKVYALIQSHGGVDLCVGGLGLNGHVAFNEPQPAMDIDTFMQLPARVVPVAPETLVVNGLNEYEGAYELMPRFAATLGFREIAASKRIVLGCFRPWHKMVVRKAALYPPTTEFPVSLLQDMDMEICIPQKLV